MNKYIRVASLCAATLFSSMPHAEQAYPAKPLAFVVPYEPGGTTDVLIRALVPSVSKTLGQTVVVENRPGASATIGGAYVARAKPDGYTFLIGAADTSTSKFFLKSMPYDPESALEMVSRVAWTPYFLIANNDVKANDLPSIRALADKQEGGLTYASAGTGTIPHLAGEQFAMLHNLEMLHVPFKGTAPAMNELIAGRVNFMFVGLPSSIAHIKSGRLKAIAVASNERVPFFSEVPTFSEIGGKDFNSGSWFGVLAPKGTPDDIKDKVAEALRTALDSENVKGIYEKFGAVRIQETPAEAQKFYLSDFKRWEEVVKQISVK